ncbi:hypothetical protein Dip510_000062 [Elusimicrobium posterum]|uniref:hypothetical protein n=1 Tax=Elusimicrobium posterum TaxID=3116653 RepID=UPI003C724709
MKFRYYNLFNLQELDTLSVPYITRTFELDKDGTAEVSLHKGQHYSIVANGCMLTPGLNGRNPFISHNNKLAAYLDEDKNIWLGFYYED